MLFAVNAQDNEISSTANYRKWQVRLRTLI